ALAALAAKYPWLPIPAYSRRPIAGRSRFLYRPANRYLRFLWQDSTMCRLLLTRGVAGSTSSMECRSGSSTIPNRMRPRPDAGWPAKVTANTSSKGQSVLTAAEIVPRSLYRRLHCPFERAGQGCLIPLTVVADSVDKERGSAVDPTPDPAHEVLPHVSPV